MALEDPRYCPECGVDNNNSVYTDLRSHEFEVVFVCNECTTQWTVTYADPYVSDIQTDGEL